MIIALLVAGIVSAIVVAMSRDFDLNYRRSANSAIAEQTWAYLRGAEALVTLALVFDYEADQLAGEPFKDDLTELWARGIDPYPLEEGGFLGGFVLDLQGLFNLNSLVDTSGSGEGDAQNIGVSALTSTQLQFVRLLQALPGVVVDQIEARALTEAIIDFLDADDEPRLNGAESSFYVAQNPAYRAANRELSSVSELRSIANMRPEVFEALQHYVTVWPKNASQINIHTAPGPVLRSLNPETGVDTPLDEAIVQNILERRSVQPFADLDEFLSPENFPGAETTETIRGLVTERSSYFLLGTVVEIADRRQHMYSWVERDERDIRVLQRREASLNEYLVSRSLIPEIPQ
ncbi:MAG: type II secretion system minor pseudopilin GspK [Pseudomonadota bacterium]